jgi:hypothetical protein
MMMVLDMYRKKLVVLLAVGHAVPAGNWEVIVAFKFISVGTLHITYISVVGSYVKNKVIPNYVMLCVSLLQPKYCLWIGSSGIPTD